MICEFDDCDKGKKFSSNNHSQYTNDEKKRKTDEEKEITFIIKTLSIKWTYFKPKPNRTNNNNSNKKWAKY